MIKGLLSIIVITTLAAVNPTAESTLVVNQLVTQEDTQYSFCLFENGLPFRRSVNPKKINVIAPLLPFFEQVAKTLAQPLAIDFVDESSEEAHQISFTPAYKEMPAILFISKEILETIPSRDLERLCAQAIAKTLTPQPLLTFAEKILSCSNNTAKTLLFWNLAKIGIISINNKKLTTNTNDGSSLLVWGSGTAFSWVVIKTLQALIKEIKEKKIKQKSLIFLKKELPAVPLN